MKLALLFVLLAMGLSSRGSLADPRPPAPGVVTIGPVPCAELRAGTAVTLAIPVQIAPGFHVQANPASDAFLIPLQLDFDSAPGLRCSAPVYPEASKLRLEGADEDWLTYEGTLFVELPVTAAADAQPGERLLEGRLRYQACDSQRCLFPTTLPLTLRVVVLAAR